MGLKGHPAQTQSFPRTVQDHYAPWPQTRISSELFSRIGLSLSLRTEGPVSVVALVGVEN